MESNATGRIFAALEKFRIEASFLGLRQHRNPVRQIPSTRRGSDYRREIQRCRPSSRVTGICPTVALHVLWDFPKEFADTEEIKKLADAVRSSVPGSINPNLFQDQEYKYGSFGNPDAAVARERLQHTLDSIEIANA